MTALHEYDRLESLGQFSDDMGYSDLEVVVSLGDASLVISTLSGDHIAHWSLPAVQISDQTSTTMTLIPAVGATDTIVLDDPTMRDAIRKIRRSLDTRGQKPWAKKFGVTAVTGLALFALVAFALPNWMIERAGTIPPKVRQVEISSAIVAELAGPHCETEAGQAGLDALIDRVFPVDPPMIYVVNNLTQPSLALPGNVILLSGELIATVDDPSVIAGYLLSAHVTSLTTDPMTALVEAAGAGSALSLLTTGDIRESDIAKMVGFLRTSVPSPSPVPLLLTAFDVAELSATPYANNLTHEQRRLDIEKGDPFPNGSPFEVLNDGLWLGLQDICSN